MQEELRAAAAKQATSVTCCWCGVAWDVDGEGGLPARRHSDRGHRVEPWRIADWLKNDKNKQSRQLGCTWALSGKNRRNAFQTNGRARGVLFLILVCI